MRLVARLLGIESGGKRIVVVDDDVARRLGVKSLDRLSIRVGERQTLGIVNVARSLPKNLIGMYEEVAQELDLKGGEEVEVLPVEAPESLGHLRELLRGKRLRYPEVKQIISDMVKGRLNDVEIASLVTTLHYRGMDVEQAYYFTQAMVETGRTLELDKDQILDKHSLGGVAGDKTTLLVVPIIASLGYTIPKTSSRAITSPAGTADRVEVLCPVALSIEEMKEVVLKTNGCMVWGGALGLAPADDLIIRVEYPLSIDPFFLPSVMAKKMAVGSTHVVIDIPVGRGAKVKTIGEGRSLSEDFMELGRRLGIHVECAITYGGEPVGYGVGPALEAREAIETLMGNGPKDLIDKACSLAGVLLESVGRVDGKALALEVLRSGRAEQKLREMIEAQGGDPGVMPEDVEVGERRSRILSERDGFILWINSSAIAQIGKAAGAPKDKGAGVLLHGKIGKRIERNDVLFEIYAEVDHRLLDAEKLVSRLVPIGVGESYEEQMLIQRMPTTKEHERWFSLVR